MNKKSFFGVALTNTLSIMLSFLGIVTCCGMPIVAGVLAWLGIGASQLAFFAEYQELFMLIAVASLLFGFWKVYSPKKTTACCNTQTASTTSCCGNEPKKQTTAKSPSNRFQKIFLWIATGAVISMLLWGIKETPIKSKETNLINKTQDTVQEKNNSNTATQPTVKDTTSSCCSSN